MFIFLLFFVGHMAAVSQQGQLRPYTYLYPVDTLYIDGQEHTLTLWQKECDTIELYARNNTTGIAHKQLPSSYIPAGIQVLPGRQAYSFIDNGCVRIKECLKRSPATMVFDKPIFNISILHWVTDDIAYCHAQEGHRFGIYMINRSGSVQRLLYNQTCDYLFPSQVDDTLFYICRVMHEGRAHHAIAQVPFTTDVPYDDTIFYAQEEPILQAGSLSIAFLRMQSKNRGFVLVYPNTVEDGVQQVPFQYYMIERTANGWSAQQLFSFAVPSFLLDKSSSNRLYENMLPLLPYHDGDKIYYSSTQMHSSSMQIYCFDSATKCSKRCRAMGSRNELLFSARIVDDALYCGGSLADGTRCYVPDASCRDNDIVFTFAELH